MSDIRKDRIHTLQALRAIAAWLVVIDHVLLELTDSNPALALTHLAWTLGSAGVGIFFVVSGFIMVHVSWTQFGLPGAPLRFPSPPSDPDPPALLVRHLGRFRLPQSHADPRCR